MLFISILRWFSIASSFVVLCIFLSVYVFFQEFRVLFVGEERLFPYLLVVRSSSSDCIGLFAFVVVIVPDCCKVHFVSMNLMGCSTLCLVVEKCFGVVCRLT